MRKRYVMPIEVDLSKGNGAVGSAKEGAQSG